MSCTDLQSLFDAGHRANDFAMQVDSRSPDCRCEAERVCSLSQTPPVEDDEHLIRIVVAPRDATDATPISFEESFSLSLIGRGFSVLREARASPDEIVSLAHHLADTAANAVPPSEIVEVIGVLRFAARVARERRLPASHKLANARTICVYETPLTDLPSHSDLLITRTKFESNGSAKREAFAFTGSVAAGFIKAADFDKANISGIRLPGRKIY